MAELTVDASEPALRRVDRARRRILYGRARRTVRTDRPERRRQDERLQLHQRHLPRRRERSVFRGGDITRPASRTKSPALGLPAPSSTGNCSRR